MATSEATRPGRPLRLILAEDDPDLRQCLAELLRHEGHQVDAVCSGVDLLSRLAGWIVGAREVPRPGGGPVDAIITDVRMPGFNGLQIVRSLRAKGWTTPAVIVTAFGSEKMRQIVDGLDRTVLIDKPIDADVFLRTVEGLLEAAQAEAAAAVKH